MKVAIIVGAGPAGLTAAYELQKSTDVVPLVFEMSQDIGGISKTVNYRGNRIDIGGHRFFSKSEKVMNWWREIMPLQSAPALDDKILGRKIKFSAPGEIEGDPEKTDLVLLLRSRLSRIFFLRSFFDYPISLKYQTFKNLGLKRIIKIAATYLKICLFPIKKEKSLEDFFINRFGEELYLTFFKDYTEKVWGVECAEIPADWGAQRIKGLSITKTVLHAIKTIFVRDSSLAQKSTETSLIGHFLYPKLGPGQLWETVAQKIVQKNGKVILGMEVVGVNLSGGHVVSVDCVNHETCKRESFDCDYFISSMPVKNLIRAFPQEIVPGKVLDVSEGLVYRDFITVGLLVEKLNIKNDTKIKTIDNNVPDNWIYIQEKDVCLGRLQLFNNWSPYLVSDPSKIWLGLEYFCNEGDALWEKSDSEFISFAIKELEKIDIIDSDNVLDATILRVPKAYPAYFGTYDKFSVIREFTDSIDNLFLVGRNGMHRYNNADHSMLSAMEAVSNIRDNVSSKENIWDVNTDEDYHEEK